MGWVVGVGVSPAGLGQLTVDSQTPSTQINKLGCSSTATAVVAIPCITQAQLCKIALVDRHLSIAVTCFLRNKIQKLVDSMSRGEGGGG